MCDGHIATSCTQTKAKGCALESFRACLVAFFGFTKNPKGKLVSFLMCLVFDLSTP